MDQLLKNPEHKLMSVAEVAKALGCDPRSVRRHINKRWPGHFQNGVPGYLNEEQATYVKLCLERSGRNDLDNVVQLPKTDLEKKMLIMQAMKLQQEEIQILQAQAAAQQFKIDFYDAVASSKGAISLGEAAKILGNIGQNRLFRLLRQEKVLLSTNLPYQKFIDRGYFRVIERQFKDSKGKTRVATKTLVFQKGLNYIRKIIEHKEAV